MITDSDLATLQRALAAYAQLDSAGGNRAQFIQVDRVQSSSGQDGAHERVDALSDAGTLATARWAHRRMVALPWEHQQVLRWLAAEGRLTVAGASREYAATHGPVALRDAVAGAVARRQSCERDVLGNRGHRGAVTHALALAQDALRSAQGVEATAEAALLAWGSERVCGAVEAWHKMQRLAA